MWVALNQISATFSPMYGERNGGFTDDPHTFPAQADLSNGANVPECDGRRPLTAMGAMISSSPTPKRSAISPPSSPYRRGGTVHPQPETGPFADLVSIAWATSTATASSTRGGLRPTTPENAIGPAFLIGDGNRRVHRFAGVGQIRRGLPRPGLAITLVDLDGNELADIVQVSADGERVTVALNTSDEVPPTVTSTATRRRRRR
jgi:hypothetical protein